MLQTIKEYLTGWFSVFVVGIILAVSLFQGYRLVDRQFYIDAPISNVFEASVFVPDFKAGQDPKVLYNSLKHQEFNGDFEVEIKRLSDKASVCRGVGLNITYSPDDKMDVDLSTLDWYIGGLCTAKLKPGEYYLETNYTIRILDKPAKYLKTISNVFKVSE